MTASGVIIAAPASGSGKTTVTLGLLRALRDAGVTVAAAKVGPDYIDPGFHALACGRPCVNLDPWAMRPTTVAALITDVSANAELVVCEGVMGLYDGVDAAGAASTADLAATVGWPVVLVVDARGLAASAGAMLSGFVHPPASLARAGLTVAGVIFNRIGGPSHAAMLRDVAGRAMPDVPVLGCIPRTAGLGLPERHLGLVPAQESPDTERVIGDAARIVAEAVDLSALRALARPPRCEPTRVDAPIPPLGQRIAVARDDAFVFAYPWLLDAWRAAGAELSFFSPLADQAPNEHAAAVYLPGGYPELHAGKLAGNTRVLEALRDAAARGTAIYGECGGYMMLGRALVDAAGVRHTMAGLLPVTTSFAERRLHLGYREVTLAGDSPLGGAGARFRGHEFHYASVADQGEGHALFAAYDAAGHALPRAGHRSGSVSGSFIHLVDQTKL